MANVDREIRDVFHGREIYAISGAATTISQGDMIQWDATSRIATNAVMASGAIFLGVCDSANPLASLGTSTQPLTGNRVRVLSQGIFNMKTTNGETYSHLDAVFPDGTDLQKVTLNSASRIVGRVHLPLGNQVVGTGSNTVPVRILGSMTQVSTIPSSAAGAK